MSVPGATRRSRPLGVVGGQPVPIGSRCRPPQEERRSDTREAQSAQSFPGGWSSRAVRCEVHSAQSFPGGWGSYEVRMRLIRLNRFPKFAVLVQYTSSTPTDAGQRGKNRSQSRTVEPGLMFAIVTFVRTDVTPPSAVLCGTWFLQQRANYCCDVRTCVNVVVYS